MRIMYEEAINRCAFQVRILTTCVQTAKENEDVNGNRSDVGASHNTAGESARLISKKGKNKTD